VGSAGAADDPLHPPGGAPPPSLDRAALEQSLPVRQTCRELVRLVNRQGELWQLVREGARDRAEFRGDQARLEEGWRSARSRCDLGIVGLPRGLARDVLDHELALIDGLQGALGAVVAAYLAEQAVPAINERIDAYDLALRAWTDWLPASAGFWNGDLVDEPRERSCLADLRASARDVSSELWQLATQVTDERDPQDLVNAEAMLRGLRTEHGRCAGEATQPAARVEHRLVGELLATYEQLLAGIGGSDDDLIRAAMDEEQRATGRLVRCRAEHAAGRVSRPCAAE
jgi:hypothetical protein